MKNPRRKFERAGATWPHRPLIDDGERGRSAQRVGRHPRAHLPLGLDLERVDYSKWAAAESKATRAQKHKQLAPKTLERGRAGGMSARETDSSSFVVFVRRAARNRTERVHKGGPIWSHVTLRGGLATRGLARSPARGPRSPARWRPNWIARRVQPRSGSSLSGGNAQFDTLTSGRRLQCLLWPLVVIH